MFEENDFDLDENWFNDELENNPAPIAISINKINIESPKQKIVLKRKFPGPAGLFPEGPSPSKVNNDNSVNNSRFILSTQLLCSQSPEAIFEVPAWVDMCRDFGDNSTESLTRKYNINRIKNSSFQDLTCLKVPFLSAIIKEVKNTSKSPIFVLADTTGEIEALISSELYEEYNEYLGVNSVVVLKEFSILFINNFKYYINIIADNLVRIYSCKDVDEDEVKIIHIRQISNAHLQKEINESVSKSQNCSRTPDNKTEERKILKNEQRNSLFNNEFRTSHCRKLDSGNEITGHNTLDKYNLNAINLSRNMDSNSILKDKNPIITTNVKEKFDFKNVLNVKASEGMKNFTENNNSGNIFNQSNGSLDLDLSIDDFQDEFVVPNNTEDMCHSFSHKDGNKLHKSKIQNSFSTETFSNRMRTLVDFDLETKQTGKDKNSISTNKIDCSQIVIISQNNENPDIIKEVFSDLDPSSLFDDF